MCICIFKKKSINLFAIIKIKINVSNMISLNIGDIPKQLSTGVQVSAKQVSTQRVKKDPQYPVFFRNLRVKFGGWVSGRGPV